MFFKVANNIIMRNMTKKLTSMGSKELLLINNKVGELIRHIRSEENKYFRAQYIGLHDHVLLFKKANLDNKNPFLKKYLDDVRGIQRGIKQEKEMHSWLLGAEKSLLLVEKKLSGQANGQLKKDIMEVRSFLAQEDYVQKIIDYKPFRAKILKKIRDYTKLIEEGQMAFEF